SWAAARVPLMFRRALSLVGLTFYPAILLILAFIAYSWRKGRLYDTVMMIALSYGGYNFYSMPPFSRMVFLFGIALIALLILRKSQMVRRTFVVMGFYAAALFIVAWHSIEPLSHQLPILSKYLNFLFFVIPLLIFSGKPFDFDKLWQSVFVFCMLICVFYILDYFVFCGFVMMPFCTDNVNTFYDPDWAPLTFYFRRHRPPGLYFLVLIIYPLARGWKMPWWSWVLILLSLAATQTFTVLTGFIVAFVISQGTVGKYLKYVVAGVMFFAAIYAADVMITNGQYVDTPEGPQSKLRVESSVMQIVGINNIQDEEDLARLGTGRMAQTIPKVALIKELGMQGMGFGFLHPQLTTNPIFIVYNPFYTDISRNQELASEVEITPVQVYLHMGWFGLVVQGLWLVSLWLVVRRQPMAKYFLVVLIY
ncbi:MAG: hypothetical protein K2O10_07045, partial [Muribaculaceae bacterium]|nr:hypothetical protein [Muribaculaceae bacterium]